MKLCSLGSWISVVKWQMEEHFWPEDKRLKGSVKWQMSYFERKYTQCHCYLLLNRKFFIWLFRGFLFSVHFVKPRAMQAGIESKFVIGILGTTLTLHLAFVFYLQPSALKRSLPEFSCQPEIMQASSRYETNACMTSPAHFRVLHSRLAAQSKQMLLSSDAE